MCGPGARAAQASQDPSGDRYRPYRSYAAWYCWQAVHIARGQMVTPGD